MLGACLSPAREARWQRGGLDARRSAQTIVITTDKPGSAADGPLTANPSGPGIFLFIRRCLLLIGFNPTTSVPPRLKGNMPGSRPRAGVSQAPEREAQCVVSTTRKTRNDADVPYLSNPFGPLLSPIHVITSAAATRNAQIDSLSPRSPPATVCLTALTLALVIGLPGSRHSNALSYFCCQRLSPQRIWP